MPSREPVATEADDRSFTVLDREFTETGDAAVFVEQQHGRLIYVPGLGWFLWDGGRWQRDQVGEALYRTLGVLAEIRARRVRADEDDQGRILQHYQRASSARGRKAVLALAEVDPALRVLVDDLDRDPLLLALPNGWTLDLRADPIQVRKSKPEDRITKVAGVEFNPHATCPRWLEHVKLVTQDDSLLAAFLQRWCGYTLTGLTSEQKFHFLYGEGDNGKNVFVEVLLAILGEYAMRGSTKILDASSRGEHETVIADLAGMRMVFIDEIPNGRINEERLKELTGTKELRARKMRSDTFQFEARFKLWLAGNNKPRIRDTSLGFWRRLHLSPFNAVIPEDQRIKDYAQRLFDAEGSGILNWCIEGLRDYRTIGGLGAPATVTRAGEDYRDEEDSSPTSSPSGSRPGPSCAGIPTRSSTRCTRSGARRWGSSRFLWLRSRTAGAGRSSSTTPGRTRSGRDGRTQSRRRTAGGSGRPSETSCPCTCGGHSQVRSPGYGNSLRHAVGCNPAALGM